MRIDGLTYDVAAALGDDSPDMLRHSKAATTPTGTELVRWHESIGQASAAHMNLFVASEDIVEFSVSGERIKRMKQASAQSEGNAAYVLRKDRWQQLSALTTKEMVRFSWPWIRCQCLRW